MKRSGRPRKAAAAAKTLSVEFRVTPSEKEAFWRAAEIAGIDASTWIRERLRRAAVRELEEADEIAAFLRK